MRPHRSTAFVALMAVGLLVSPASAVLLESKNKKGAECSARWDVSGSTFAATKGKAGNWKLDCADGADCDTDGVVNNECVVSLAACAAVAVDGCTPTPVSEFKFAPRKKIDQLRSGGFNDPPINAATESCGEAGTVQLPLKVKKNGKVKPSKPFKAVMKFRDGSGKGKSKVKIRCVEGQGGGGTTTTTIPGGNGFCPDTTPGNPKQIAYTVPPTGSDLDNGWQGDSHNFPVVNGSTLTYCLSNCDATTDSLCDGHGPTGEDSINGPTFGAPLPLLAANVPVCVINRFQEDFQGTVDLATGDSSSLVKLFADTYVTGNSNDICPRCNASGGIGSTGTCSSSARRAGQSCTVEGLVQVPGSSGDPSFKLSSDCIPPNSQLAGTLDIQLPLTTAESSITGSRPCTDPGRGLPPQDDNCGGGSCTGSCGGAACVTTDGMGRCLDAKGGISQLCCSNNASRPCFPSAPDSGGVISRTGTPMVPQPAWPDPSYPKTAEANVFAAVFCEGATGSTQVNLVTGLPGPGALLLPGDAVLTATE